MELSSLEETENFFTMVLATCGYAVSCEIPKGNFGVKYKYTNGIKLGYTFVSDIVFYNKPTRKRVIAEIVSTINKTMGLEMISHSQIRGIISND